MTTTGGRDAKFISELLLRQHPHTCLAHSTGKLLRAPGTRRALAGCPTPKTQSLRRYIIPPTQSSSPQGTNIKMEQPNIQQPITLSLNLRSYPTPAVQQQPAVLNNVLLQSLFYCILNIYIFFTNHRQSLSSVPVASLAGEGPLPGTQE